MRIVQAQCQVKAEVYSRAPHLRRSGGNVLRLLFLALFRASPCKLPWKHQAVRVVRQAPMLVM